MKIQKRIEAMGNYSDYKPESKVLNYMIENAERLFVPMQIYSKDDWLASKREKG